MDFNKIGKFNCRRRIIKGKAIMISRTLRNQHIIDNENCDDSFDDAVLFSFIYLVGNQSGIVKDDAFANLWEIRQRKKAGIQWHTYYWGTPRFLPDNAFIRCLIIPLGSGGMAYGFYRLSPPLGIYLYCMAAMQFVDAVDSYRTKRIKKLDRSDREIGMEIKTAELENRNRGSLEIVRVAKPSSRMRLPEEIEQFEARWKNVLKSSDDSQNPAL